VILAPEHFAWYFVATACTRGCSAVEPDAVSVPVSQVYAPGVPSVGVGVVALVVGVLAVVAVGVDELPVSVLPHAEITRPSAIAVNKMRARRHCFNIDSPTLFERLLLAIHFPGASP
jgi:hypothetical protein